MSNYKDAHFDKIKQTILRHLLTMDWPAAPGTLSILTYASSPLPVTRSIYQPIWQCNTLLLFSWSDRTSPWCRVSNEVGKSRRLWKLNKLAPIWNLSYPHILLGCENWQTTFHLQMVEVCMAKIWSVIKETNYKTWKTGNYRVFWYLGM